MKKLCRLFLSMAVMICAVFAFVGCGNTPEAPPANPPSGYQNANEAISAVTSKLGTINYYQVEMSYDSNVISTIKFEQTQDKLKILLDDGYYERTKVDGGDFKFVRYNDETNVFEDYNGEGIYTIEYILSLKDNAQNVSMTNDNGTYVVKFTFASEGEQESYIKCYIKDDKLVKCENKDGESDDIFTLNYKYENIPVEYDTTGA